MTETKGHCKHGEFILAEGCPDCIQEERERREAESLGEEIPEPEIPYEDEAKLALHEAEPAAETALVLRPGEDIEAHGYFKEAMKLLKYAQGRVIATVDDIKIATDDLSIIARLKKAMEEKRKKYLEPLKAQTEAIRLTYEYLMLPIFEADKITRGKILIYQKEQARIREEQEEINRLRMEAAQKEMELKGEITESVDLVEVAPEAPKRVSTDMGTAGQRDNWKWEVVDFALLPDEYKVVDGSMLTAIAKKHHDQKQIPGVRFYNEPIITVRAR